MGSDFQFRLLIFFITKRMRIVDLNERLNLSSSNVTLGTEAQGKKKAGSEVTVNDQEKMTFFLRGLICSTVKNLYTNSSSHLAVR